MIQFEPLGDSAVTITFPGTDGEKPLGDVLSAAQSLAAAKIVGVTEVISSYESITLFLDLPALTKIAGRGAIDDFLQRQVRAALAAPPQSEQRAVREVEIPVCYDLQLDLARVAAETNLSEEEIISRHGAAVYRVACHGFMPGFPYLAGLPGELVVPRLPTPRTHVPAGSVAIAAGQAGIYPQESPGGWNVIGRTPIRLFDSNANPPALLQTGDRVTFRAISRAQFEAMTR